ncbi:MAG: serpin family protein [Planctomycetes bacterium]|nr:serpin family protein [Planctomycetota bacterium]
MWVRAWLIAGAIVAVSGCDRAPEVAPPRVAHEADDTKAAGATASSGETPPPEVRTRVLAPPVEWSDRMQAAVEGANRFAVALHRLRAADGGNRFCSPFSLHAALAMTAAGARGATLDELRAVLHLPDAEGPAAVGDLARYYAAGSPHYELAVSSALWGQTGLAWNDRFVTLLDEHFAAGFRTADFAADPERERQRVNADVAAATRGRIAALVPPGSFTALTRLCLTNAIFFKGSWRTTFAERATAPQSFHRADGSTVAVPLMHRTGTEAHLAGDAFQLLALPYEGGELEMVILLPAEAGALPALEARLDAGAVAEWRIAAEQVDVSIWLPRFRLDDRLDARAVLGSLGVATLFVPGSADLTGMTESERLAVAAVLHQAFVEVNEEGTEAAAATAVIANAPGPPPPRRVEFRADRPFLFLIRDVRHGTILFVGRYAEPQ